MKVWLVAGETVISAEEVKALLAVSTTHIIIASWFCLQSHLERKWDWCGLVQLVPFVRGVNGMET